MLLLLILAGGADAGSPSRGDPGVVPFFARDANTGAAVVGAIDLIGGKRLWTSPLALKKDSSPTLQWRGSEVVVSRSSPEGVKTTGFYDLFSGRRRLDIPGGCQLTFQNGEGRLLLDFLENEVKAVDTRTGSTVWTRTGPRWNDFMARKAGHVLLFTGGATWAAVDVATGRELWTRKVESATSHCRGGGRLWMYRRAGPTLRELDAATGREIRSLEAPEGIRSAHVVGPRLILCLRDRVLALRLDDLAIEWTWMSPDPPDWAWGSRTAVVIDHGERGTTFLDAVSGRFAGRMTYPENKGSGSSLHIPGLYVFELVEPQEGSQARVYRTTDGSVLWEGNDAKVYTQSASDLLLVRQGAFLFRLHPLSGEKLWSRPTEPIQTMLLQRGRVVVVRGTQAVALDPSTGLEFWRTELGVRATHASFGWRSPF
jgi:outer membrane protein assembly factor BamB